MVDPNSRCATIPMRQDVVRQFIKVRDLLVQLTERDLYAELLAQ